MRKQVKITFERFKLLRHVLAQAQFLTTRPPGDLDDGGEGFCKTLQALKDAVSAVNLHEARAAAHEMEAGIGVENRPTEHSGHPDDSPTSLNPEIYFCKSCSDALDPTKNFCPECGYDQGL